MKENEMAHNTIMLAGEYRKIESMELATGNAPYPGMCLKETADGELAIQTTEGIDGELIIALEDQLQGGTVDDVYTAGEICDAAIPLTGTEFQVLVAAGEDIARGDILTVSATGKFEEHTGTYKRMVVAREDCDLTASGAVDTLCWVRRI